MGIASGYTSGIDTSGGGFTIVGNLAWIMFPLIVRGIGVISSIVGTFAVALWKTPDAEKAMFNSYELSSAIWLL